MKIAIVLGTRPEIIKLAPIIKKLNSRNSCVIFTGQHYDYDMGLRFIKQLGLRKPDHSMRLSRGSTTEQIGQIISRLAPILRRIEPDSVLVQGDTNSVLAGAVSSLKSGIPVSHLEAGLRSFDWRMQEEHNRIATDHISELLFAPTKTSKTNLQSENVHGKIFVTGNTIIDSIDQYFALAEKNSKLNLGIKEDYALLTFHRAENVDDKNVLKSVMCAILETKENVVFPVHPRTLKKLKKFGLYQKLVSSKNIKLLGPVGYFDMLLLMKYSGYILTDSGGIQEEATSPLLRKKVIILRQTTDRPEAVKSGFATMAGLEQTSIKKAIRLISSNPKLPKRKSPFGDGTSSKKVIDILRKNF